MPECLVISHSRDLDASFSICKLRQLYTFYPYLLDMPTDAVSEGFKQHPPYTRSVLRPILVHTSLNAHPIQGIGQAVCQVITNNSRSTVRALGGDGQQATETHQVANKLSVALSPLFDAAKSDRENQFFATNYLLCLGLKVYNYLN